MKKLIHNLLNTGIALTAPPRSWFLIAHTMTVSHTVHIQPLPEEDPSFSPSSSSLSPDLSTGTGAYSFWNLLIHPPPDPPAILHHEPSSSFVIHKVAAIPGADPLTSSPLPWWARRVDRRMLHFPIDYPTSSSLPTLMPPSHYTEMIENLNRAGNWDQKYIKAFGIFYWLTVLFIIFIPVAILATALSNPLERDEHGKVDKDGGSATGLVIFFCVMLTIPIVCCWLISRYCYRLAAHRMAASLEDLNTTHEGVRVWLLQTGMRGMDEERSYSPGARVVRELIITPREIAAVDGAIGGPEVENEVDYQTEETGASHMWTTGD